MTANSFQKIINNLELAKRWRGKQGFTVRSTFTREQASNLLEITKFLFENEFYCVSVENSFVCHDNTLHFDKKDIDQLKIEYNKFIT